MSMPIGHRMTSRTRHAISLAHDLADRVGHDHVTPVHMVLGMLHEGGNLAMAALFESGVPLDTLEREFEKRLPLPGVPRTPTTGHTWTPSDEQMIEQAKVEAKGLGADYLACEHLLLAFLRDDSSDPAQVLANYGVRYNDFRTGVLHLYQGPPESTPPASLAP